MSCVAQPNIERGNSSFVQAEFDEDRESVMELTDITTGESVIGLTKITPGESIILGWLKTEATSDCAGDKIYPSTRTPATPGDNDEVIELGKIHTFHSQCDSIALTRSSSINKKERRKRGGDCHQLNGYKCSSTFCILSLLTILIVCFIFNPQNVWLCLKLHLNDKDIMQKVLNDKESYEMNFINPNSIDVYIYGLEIKVYYGGVVDENLLLKADKMDFHIPAHGKYSSNQTYTFIKSSTAAVPMQTLRGCSMGYRQFIAFDMVTSFEACVLKFICPGRIVKESIYKSNCPEDDMVCTNKSNCPEDHMVCTKFDIFQ